MFCRATTGVAVHGKRGTGGQGIGAGALDRSVRLRAEDDLAVLALEPQLAARDAFGDARGLEETRGSLMALLLLHRAVSTNSLPLGGLVLLIAERSSIVKVGEEFELLSQRNRSGPRGHDCRNHHYQRSKAAKSHGMRGFFPDFSL